jgi:hypothetical protein
VTCIRHPRLLVPSNVGYCEASCVACDVKMQAYDGFIVWSDMGLAPMQAQALAVMRAATGSTLEYVADSRRWRIHRSTGEVLRTVAEPIAQTLIGRGYVAQGARGREITLKGLEALSEREGAS